MQPVIMNCLQQAALVNYTRVSEYAKIDGEFLPGVIIVGACRCQFFLSKAKFCNVFKNAFGKILVLRAALLFLKSQ